MAKYTITHGCGCTTEINLYGPHSDRDRKIATLERLPCTDCKAREIATSDRPFEGSSKQIIWAAEIRRQFDTVAADLKARGAANADHPAVVRTFALIDDDAARTSARWWIDNQHYFASARTYLEWLKSRVDA